jgi:hypothetical protein
MTSSDSNKTVSSKTEVIYNLDFDGVLVDSAAETGRSGWRAARALFPDQPWLKNSDSDIDSDGQAPNTFIERFIRVRPILYVGWESIVICQLLGDPALGLPSVEEILQKFHGDGDNYDPDAGLKAAAMKHAGLQVEDYHRAFKEARDKWIMENNGRDWIEAHDFFGGACQAVRDFLQATGDAETDKNVDKYPSDRCYIITTKAKDFALRLLEQQGLYDSSNPSNRMKIQESHVFGLGSGSKSSVLQQILKYHDDRRQQDSIAIAVMIEDNLSTLQTIKSSDIGDRVVPVVASWGYITEEQLQVASNAGYFILQQNDPGSLKEVLDDSSIKAMYTKMSGKES